MPGSVTCCNYKRLWVLFLFTFVAAGLLLIPDSDKPATTAGEKITPAKTTSSGKKSLAVKSVRQLSVAKKPVTKSMPKLSEYALAFYKELEEIEKTGKAPQPQRRKRKKRRAVSRGRLAA